MDYMDGALIDSQRLAESDAVDVWLKKWKGYKSYTRVQAFVALDGERKYQDNLHTDTNQEPLSIPGELVLLQIYIQKAMTIYADTLGDPKELPIMDVIRKIAAIAFRCMENHGAVERKKDG